MARKSGKPASGKALSAHEAGQLSSHKSQRPVRYDPDEVDDKFGLLTVREEEVLSLMAENKDNSEISTATGIKVATVEKHIEHIYPKLGVNSRAEAAIWFLMRKMEALKRENAELKRQLRAVSR